MEEDQHFMPAENLLKVTNKKLESDVIRNTQLYAEKVISDILVRASLLTRHVDKDTIDVSEISIVVEKDFDYSFGLRALYEESNLPTTEHVDRLAEISRHK